MPHRTRKWIWPGRAVAAFGVVGLIVCLFAVGLNTAGQLGSAASAVVALIGLLAPYLLPPPKAEPTVTVNKFADVISGNSGTIVNTVICHATLSLPQHLPSPTWPLDPVGDIPLRASAFQARTSLQVQVEAARTSGRAVVLTQVLSGGGGVGKSQLAAFYAREAINRRTDLVLWVNASAPGAITAAYAQAAARVQARGVTGQAADIEADAQKFLEWAAGTERSWLIVLDDVTDPGQLIRWCPDSTGTGWALATTRRRDADLTGSDRRLVNVDVYSPVESAAYLSERLIDSKMAHLLDEQARSRKS